MGNSIYRCHKCGEKFYNTDDLHSHTKKNHPKVSSRNKVVV